MKYNKLLPDFSGVAATGTAICDITAEVAGRVLESILVKLGGGALTRAMIPAWRIKGDGKILRQSSAVDTDTIYKYFGGTNTASELMIDFMAPWAATSQARCQGAWDLAEQLSRVKRATLELDIVGATTPAVTARAALSDSMDIAEERPFRWVMLREERSPIVITGAGDANISSQIPNFMPVEGGSVYRQIHFFSSTMTHLRLRKDGYDWFDKISVADLQAEQKKYKRVPQSNHVCLDPGLEGLMGRVLDTTKYSSAILDVAKAMNETLPGAGVCKNADIWGTFSGAETFYCQTQEFQRAWDN